MADPFCPRRPNVQQVISAARVDHLPIVAHFARRLGLVEMINRLVTTEMEVDAGQDVAIYEQQLRTYAQPIDHESHPEKTCRQDIEAIHLGGGNAKRSPCEGRASNLLEC